MLGVNSNTGYAIIDPDTVLIAISQSETADTLAAILVLRMEHCLFM